MSEPEAPKQGSQPEESKDSAAPTPEQVLIDQLNEKEEAIQKDIQSLKETRKSQMDLIQTLKAELAKLNAINEKDKRELASLLGENNVMREEITRGPKIVPHAASASTPRANVQKQPAKLSMSSPTAMLPVKIDIAGLP